MRGIAGCLFINVTSGAPGGAVLIDNGAANPEWVVVTNTQFRVITQTGGEGGALYLTSGEVGILHCTFYTNSAASGGAIHQAAGSSSVTNSIAWLNSAATGPEIRLVGGAMGIGYSNVDDDRIAGAVTYAPTNFSGNEDPGFRNEAAFDLRLRPDSLMLGAGPLLADIPTDINGLLRGPGDRVDLIAHPYGMELGGPLLMIR